MNGTILRGRGQWIYTLNEYRIKLGITWDDLRGMKRKELKIRIKEYDTKLWLEGMQE